MNIEKLKNALIKKHIRYSKLNSVNHYLQAVSNNMSIQAIENVLVIIKKESCIDCIVSTLKKKIASNDLIIALVCDKIKKDVNTIDEVFEKAESITQNQEYNLIIQAIEKNDLRLMRKIHF